MPEPIPLADLLAFEDEHPKNGARKEEAIIRTFGVTPVRYFQQLHRVIDTIEAESLGPMLVHRLRRIRHARGTARMLRMMG